MTTAEISAPASGRSLRIGASDYPLLLPSFRDPRLHLAAVVVSLQVLGQTALGFDLSIAQILVALGTCALLEIALTFRSRRVILWPASALLTGNGVAIILRVPGTEHGDWWSLRGWYIFAAVAAIGLLSKYVITHRGSPLFNPANLGLVIGFLLLGSSLAEPQDLWWGPLSPGLVAALAVIVAGGLAVTARLGLLGIAAGFWLTFAAGTGVLALSGHCMTARWHLGPVCDGSYWWVLVTSPEILVFMLFMITDPRTTPANRPGRVAHGVVIGVLATLLVATQTTEYGTKVGILAALVLTSAARPLLERASPRLAAITAHPRGRTIAGLAGVGVASLLVASTLALSSTTDALDDEAGDAVSTPLIDRPLIDLPSDAVPEVEIAEEVRSLSSSMHADEAHQIGIDLAENLVIESRAMASGDAELVTAATSGERRRQMMEQIRTAPDGFGAVPVHRFDSMEVVVVRGGHPQSPPRIGLHVIGAIGLAASADAAWDEVSDVDPLDRTFLFEQVGGVRLTVAALSVPE